MWRKRDQPDTERGWRWVGVGSNQGRRRPPHPLHCVLCKLWLRHFASVNSPLPRNAFLWELLLKKWLAIWTIWRNNVPGWEWVTEQGPSRAGNGQRVPVAALARLGVMITGSKRQDLAECKGLSPIERIPYALSLFHQLGPLFSIGQYSHKTGFSTNQKRAHSSALQHGNPVTFGKFLNSCCLSLSQSALGLMTLILKVFLWDQKDVMHKIFLPETHI